ncbi:PhnE/PtxC family ABC transporter permease [Xylanimonas ulmi]|uniref:ABC-type phosphate/phosphonate transport system permease subunit n=1 Tax=Xylanimonas ulmi TaxID=228973 RepID=A0A4Q7M1X1_9MICO|nr:ABC transporter permease subunit [Xylanibacterium ulmi]RZS61424.1 ABC-type phosphate/phosphonate transport system permease subunit [Xylanibacterium ulmi]
MSADTLARPQAPAARIPLVSGQERRFFTAALAVIVGATALTTWITGFNPLAALAGMPSALGFVAADYLPPTVNNGGLLARALVETVALALTSTLVASALAFLAALIGCRAVSPLPWAAPIVRGFATLVRNIPDLVWAVILFTAMGFGFHVGFAALTLGTFGFLTRAFIESMDEVSADTTETLAAVGASFPQRVMQSIVPSFTKDFIAWFLYCIEVSIRGATIVGMLGGGGVGMLLNGELGLARWRPRAMGTILILAVLVIAVDLLTSYLRTKLLNPSAARSAADRSESALVVRRGRIAVTQRGRDREVNLFLLCALALSLAAFWPIRDASWGRLLTDFPHLSRTLFELASLDFSAWDRTWTSFLDTMGIAVLSTVYSAILALLIAPFATRNLVRNPVGPALITSVATLIRTIPNPVLVMMAIAPFGLGVTPGIIGLTLSSTAFFVRVFVQGYEDVPDETIEALQATGAGRVQVFLSAMLPASRSHMVAWIGMRFEMNFMGSAILGMVGAGGVGGVINEAVRGRQFGVAGVAILLVFVFAFALELTMAKVKRTYIR